jgi:hypothetical protein
VGLYRLNAIDPELESTWFQHLNLKCDIHRSTRGAYNANLNVISWFQNVLSKYNLHRLRLEEKIIPAFERTVLPKLPEAVRRRVGTRWGCVQFQSS